MTVRDTILSKLTDQLTPEFLEVIDESERHRGHAGWREGGETHFRVRIATRYFAGKTRVTQHRLVMDALASELQNSIHALAIEVVTPDGPLIPDDPA